MIRILLLIAVSIIIILIAFRWIFPNLYRKFKKDYFEIKEDMDKTDKDFN